MLDYFLPCLNVLRILIDIRLTIVYYIHMLNISFAWFIREEYYESESRHAVVIQTINLTFTHQLTYLVYNPSLG